MCGIAGLVHWVPRDGGGCRLGRARQLLAHRGPNDWGVLSVGADGSRVVRELPADYEAHWLLMLHLRLSIIDLTPAGWQPMCSVDGRHAILLNGEIYNYLGLRRELEGLGHTFRSRSDTEVLLAALQEWGVGALGRLTGMFAFAWVDLVTREVVLARDPFGIKPLYLADIDGGVAFASEPPALLALTNGPRRVDAGRLAAFLRHGVSDFGAGTLFAGVRQVPAGHWIRIRPEQREVAVPEPYWIAQRQPRRSISLAAAAVQLREMFRESIRLHLQSEVPLGIALSGGIDSAAIAALMREFSGSRREIHAFSFMADDPTLSEEPWIRVASEGAGLTVHAVRPAPGDAAMDFAAVIRRQGEPFTSPSVYAQHRVFRLAAESGVKVVLSGQGADEVLAGYPPFAAARLAGLIRDGRLLQAVKFLKRAGRLPGVGGLQMAMQAADFLIPSAKQEPIRRLVGRELVPSWMDSAWFEAHGVAPESLKHTRDESPFWAELERTLTETTLPYLLRYEDRNSMGAGLECRLPFLTPALLEFCWSLPEEYLLDHRATSKRVFREAMRGVVSDVILDRRDKVGMATSVVPWMIAGGRWVDELLDFGDTVRAPGMRLAVARRAWNGARSANLTRVGSQLWRCLSYLEWVRQFEVEGAA